MSNINAINWKRFDGTKWSDGKEVITITHVAGWPNCVVWWRDANGRSFSDSAGNVNAFIRRARQIYSQGTATGIAARKYPEFCYRKPVPTSHHEPQFDRAGEPVEPCPHLNSVDAVDYEVVADTVSDEHEVAVKVLLVPRCGSRATQARTVGMEMVFAGCPRRVIDSAIAQALDGVFGEIARLVKEDGR